MLSENCINFKNQNWRIIGTRTAQEVLAEFPDPRMGKLMDRHGLQLLLLREAEESGDLMIMRIHRPPRETVAFRDSVGEILDPDAFSLEEYHDEDD